MVQAYSSELDFAARECVCARILGPLLDYSATHLYKLYYLHSLVKKKMFFLNLNSVHGKDANVFKKCKPHQNNPDIQAQLQIMMSDIGI